MFHIAVSLANLRPLFFVTNNPFIDWLQNTRIYILSEFLPILKGGDFATHLCNVVIAGEGVGVNAIQQYVQDWVIAEHGAPVVTHFLSILTAEKQEDNYIRNYYKGYEAE